MFRLLQRAETAFIGRLLVALMWIAVLGIVLSGCSLIAPRVGPQLAKAVSRYCEQSELERSLSRESINAQIAPRRVELQCEADPPVPARSEPSASGVVWLRAQGWSPDG